MRAITLVDLDDTLFQTVRKCRADVPAERLTAMGFLKDGTALSFATPRQMAFKAWLSEAALLIPVTARSHDALRRVNLDYRSAICAHGGVIINDRRVIDEDWGNHIRGKAAEHREELEMLVERIRAEAQSRSVPVSVRVLNENDVGLYVLAKHDAADDVALASIIDAAVPEIPFGWTDHRNGNNVALMPPYLGKEHAVAHILPGLRLAYPDLPVVGVGDSLTDAPFMMLCDYAMTPTNSQLAAATKAHLASA